MEFTEGMDYEAYMDRFCWLTTSDLAHMIQVQDKFCTEKIAEYAAAMDERRALRAAGKPIPDDSDGYACTCDDCNGGLGVRTPNIQGSYKTVLRMCDEMEMRAMEGDADAMKVNMSEVRLRALERWIPELDGYWQTAEHVHQD